MKTYNGYTNYETWNVSMWLDSDEYTYQERIDLVYRYTRGAESLSAEQAERISRVLLGDDTPDIENFDNVNWQELANLWMEEIQ